MLYFAEVKNPSPGLFERTSAVFAEEHEIYYATMKGGGHMCAEASLRLIEKILPSVVVDTISITGFCLWSTCNQNVFGLLQAEDGQVFLLLHGRRHGIARRLGWISEEEKGSCAALVYNTRAPHESPFVAGVEDLSTPPSKEEQIQERFDRLRVVV